IVAALWLVPRIDPEKSARELARIVADRPEKPSHVVCLGVQPEAYRFYGRVPAVKGDLRQALEQEGASFLALVRRSDYEHLDPALRARLAILRNDRGGVREILLLGAAPATPR